MPKAGQANPNGVSRRRLAMVADKQTFPSPPVELATSPKRPTQSAPPQTLVFSPSPSVVSPVYSLQGTAKSHSPSPVLPDVPKEHGLTSAEQTAKHLKEVVRALRIDHAPARALALLDEHAGEINGNAFGEESLLLRVEAMLALGQRIAVLRLLDSIALNDVAAAHTLLLIRGELRAAADRCRESIEDFELVLTRAHRPPKQALLGLARCRQKLGDVVGAQADRDRYRREFPNEPPP